MRWSGDYFRLVFWVALVPAYLSIFVLLLAVKEMPANHADRKRWLPIRPGDLALLPSAFWHVIIIACLLSLACFSPAFLVLKAHGTGVDAAFVPMILGLMYLIYSTTAYPFGVLSDRFDRRIQIGLGAMVLTAADIVLAVAPTVWVAALGAALWGLQMGATQGVLGALIADIAPDRLRGTAFGIYDVAIGIAAFIASAAAGALWMSGGPALAFAVSACVAAATMLALWLMPISSGPVA
jgi:MFS family permease